MSRILYTLTTPVTRVNYTKIEIISQVGVDFDTGKVELLGRFVDANDANDTAGNQRLVQLTQAQLTAFLNTIISQAQAQGVLPPGSVAVTANKA